MITSERSDKAQVWFFFTSYDSLLSVDCEPTKFKFILFMGFVVFVFWLWDCWDFWAIQPRSKITGGFRQESTGN